MEEERVLGETMAEWKKRMLDESLKDLDQWKDTFRKSGYWTEDEIQKFMKPYEDIIRRNFGEDDAK